MCSKQILFGTCLGFTNSTDLLAMPSGAGSSPEFKQFRAAFQLLSHRTSRSIQQVQVVSDPPHAPSESTKSVILTQERRRISLVHSSTRRRLPILWPDKPQSPVSDRVLYVYRVSGERILDSLRTLSSPNASAVSSEPKHSTCSTTPIRFAAVHLQLRAARSTRYFPPAIQGRWNLP